MACFLSLAAAYDWPIHQIDAMRPTFTASSKRAIYYNNLWHAVSSKDIADQEVVYGSGVRPAEAFESQGIPRSIALTAEGLEGLEVIKSNFIVERLDDAHGSNAG